MRRWLDFRFYVDEKPKLEEARQTLRIIRTWSNLDGMGKIDLAEELALRMWSVDED